MAAPSLAPIPPSDMTVDVSIINTSARVAKIDLKTFVKPGPIGTQKYLSCPCYSFLIHHKPTDTRLLFDLGIRKDLENHAPRIWIPIQERGWEITVPTDVSEILTNHHVSLDSIDAIVWSHHHFDHTGDPSRFPPSTSLIVGPGFKKEFLPAYPQRQDAPITQDTIANREMHELDFSEANAFPLGPYQAVDYFKDGSLYFLSTPGHTIGHISALARTTAGADPSASTFIFMGGDIAHHAGEFRPSVEIPLPENISPDPREPAYGNPVSYCPGSLVASLHPISSSPTSPPSSYRTTPFYQTANNHNDPLAQSTIDSLPQFDGNQDILTVIAHDGSLMDVVKFFPERANGWKESGWKREGHWRFVGDFLGVGEIEQERR